MRRGFTVLAIAAMALAILCGAAFAAITRPGPTIVSVYCSAEKVESGAFSGGTGALTATCPRASAPAAVYDGEAKTFSFQRGRGFKEGKYIYTVKDTGGETCQYEVWVVDPGNAVTLDDMAVKKDADPKFPVKFFNGNFTLAGEPDEPAAWENPRAGADITNISYNKTTKEFTISKGAAFSKTDGPVTITVNGVLNFLGQYIEGARDSGTLGSFLFMVNDLDVSPASIKWNSGGTRTDTAFVIKGLTPTNIDKIELYEPGATTPKAVAASDYTAAPSDSSDTKLTFAPEFLNKLRTGSSRVRITDKSSNLVDVCIRVTDGSTDDDVKMSMESKFGIGDPIVAKVMGLTMHNIDAVSFKHGENTNDVTGKTHFEAIDGGVQVILSGVLTEALAANDKCNVAVSYDIGLGAKVVSADFTLTQEPTHDLPHKAVSPDAEIAGKAPEVAFGAEQTPATQFEVEYAILNAGVKDIKYDEYINDEGKLTDVAAKAIIGSDKHLKTLPSVKMHLTGGKTIAPITFIVDGENIVSNDAGQIRPIDAKIHKIVVKDGELVAEQLKMAGDTITDGTYQIFETLGGTLASEITMKRPYRVVVYVKDDGDYDLNDNSGIVLDPVVIEKNVGGTTGGSGSSGGCDAGAGMIALVALASIAAAKIRSSRR